MGNALNKGREGVNENEWRVRLNSIESYVMHDGLMYGWSGAVLV